MRMVAAGTTLCLLLAVPAFSAVRYEVQGGSAGAAGQVRLVILRDNQAGVEAAIAPARGGELSSLRLLHQGKWVETIYRARDYQIREGWTGKAPLLWPATGRSRVPGTTMTGDDGGYVWNGRRFDMPIHGFARDLQWRVVSRRAEPDSARVALSLEENPGTRRRFPFGFRLTVEYILRDGRLEMHYNVRADSSNSEPMPFSIGNHITFRTALLPGSDAAAMTLQTASTIEYLKTGSFPNGDVRPRSFANPVRLGEFDWRQAVSLGGYSGVPAIYLRDSSGIGIRMSHTATSWPKQPVVQFNLWGDPREGYFSPEPWVGLQNSLNQRQGLILLQPGGSWNWDVEIRFER